MVKSCSNPSLTEKPLQPSISRDKNDSRSFSPRVSLSARAVNDGLALSLFALSYYSLALALIHTYIHTRTITSSPPSVFPFPDRETCSFSATTLRYQLAPPSSSPKECLIEVRPLSCDSRFSSHLTFCLSTVSYRPSISHRSSSIRPRLPSTNTSLASFSATYQQTRSQPWLPTISRPKIWCRTPPWTSLTLDSRRRPNHSSVWQLAIVGVTTAGILTELIGRSIARCASSLSKT